jgi:hypothetical protein
MTQMGKSTFRSASIDGGEVTLWVTKCPPPRLRRGGFAPESGRVVRPP